MQFSVLKIESKQKVEMLKSALVSRKLRMFTLLRIGAVSNVLRFQPGMHLQLI